MAQHRWFDVVGATLALAVLWPIGLLAALLVKLDSPGPALFRQQRVGYRGQLFTLYKFRTMATGREEEPYSQPIHDFNSYVFSPSRRDPRITTVGWVLRRTSMDEFPQLRNIIRGELSLVGPRPEVPAIVDQFRPEYHGRHEVKPGLTGWAQIHGRSNLTYHETIMYDLEYVRDHSSHKDVKILLRTLKLVISQEGAR